MFSILFAVSVAANAWFLYKKYRDSKLITELEGKIEDLLNK